MKGLVTKSTGSWYDVLGEDERLYQARLRGKFKNQDLKVTNPIAVGDIVEFEMVEDGSVSITSILPRLNYILRKSPRKTAHAHLLAANIDQAMLVVTISSPRTSTGFIDRFLISAEAFRIPVILVFNKTDLLNDDEMEMRDALTDLYQSLCEEVVHCSALTGENTEHLRAALKGGKTLLSGHSGVGKSSVINRIAPELHLKTGEISAFSDKGTHTTTFAQMFRLDSDTFIIDTPGIKELGLIDMEKEEIAHYFPEMRALIGDCRFNNCLHVNEPGCAVKANVNEGDIHESRYYNYLGMLEEKDSYR